MTIVKRTKNGCDLESAGVTQKIKADKDVTDFIIRNRAKISYDSTNNIWKYKTKDGPNTTLAKRIYVSFKAYNTNSRIKSKVAFKNGDKYDLRRDNLTTEIGLKRIE